MEEVEALLAIACPVTAEEEEEEEEQGQEKEKREKVKAKERTEGLGGGGGGGGGGAGGDEESVLAGLGTLMLREERVEGEETGDSLVEDVEAAFKMVHDAHRADAAQDRMLQMASLFGGDASAMADAISGSTEEEKQQKLRSLQVLLQRAGKGGGSGNGKGVMDDFEAMLREAEASSDASSSALRLMPAEEVHEGAQGGGEVAAGGAAAAAAAGIGGAGGAGGAGGGAIGVGSLVEIVGLKSAADLNGTKGRVGQLVQATGRWRVQVRTRSLRYIWQPDGRCPLAVGFSYMLFDRLPHPSSAPILRLPHPSSARILRLPHPSSAASFVCPILRLPYPPSAASFVSRAIPRLQLLDVDGREVMLPTGKRRSIDIKGDNVRRWEEEEEGEEDGEEEGEEGMVVDVEEEESSRARGAGIRSVSDALQLEGWTFGRIEGTNGHVAGAESADGSSSTAGGAGGAGCEGGAGAAGAAGGARTRMVFRRVGTARGRRT
jgi:hypothetical protein